MVTLWEQDGQTVGMLCDKLRLESSTLTPLLKRLEVSGHVTRNRNPADERQVQVTLTPAGRVLREKARNIPQCIQDASGLEPKELRQLQTQILALRDALEKSGLK
jgi:MarR family transcriptional regulator, organic hydroperoxide resistance regulator